MGEMIQEYLIGLGAQIDEASLAEAQKAINKLGETVQTAMDGIAKVAQKVKDAISGVAKVIKSAMGAVVKVVQKVKAAFVAIAHAVKSSVGVIVKAAQKLKTAFVSVAKSVTSAVQDMARDFVQASTVIATSMASIATATAKLMKHTAQEDLEMEKLSRRMMVAKEDAWSMKKATDALGESVQDIMLTPELLGRFTQLTKEGRQMQVGGDFKETMKGFRDLLFEFTRLKQEVSYAMTWVGYYLMKYLSRPLADAREQFKAFNDKFVKNMSVWTEKAARGIYYVIEVGRHAIEFAFDLGKAFKRVWDEFPKGVKTATSALTALWLIMRLNPLGRMILLVGSLLILLDDYYGHMEGKQSQFGKYWDMLNGYIEKGKVLWEQLTTAAFAFWEGLPKGVKVASAALTALWLIMRANPVGRIVLLVGTLLGLLEDYHEFMTGGQSRFGEYWRVLNEYIEKGKALWEQFKELALPFWERFVELCGRAKDTAIDFARNIGELFSRISQSRALKTFLGLLINLGKSLWNLVETIGGILIDSIKELYKAFERNEGVRTFNRILERLWNWIQNIIRAFTEFCDWLRRLADEVSRTEEWKAFIDVCGELWAAILELVDAIMECVEIAFGGFYEQIGRGNEVITFKDIILLLLKAFTFVLNIVKDVIKTLKAFFKLVGDGIKVVQNFGKAVREAIKGAFGYLGTLGKALEAISRGDVKGALAILGFGSGGKSGSGNTGKGDANWNAKVAYQRLKAAGYDNVAIAGIFGRVQQEHNFDTSDAPEKYVKGVGWVGGYGMYQFTGDLKKQFLADTQAKGLDPQDPGVQTDFIIEVAKQRGGAPENLNGLSTHSAAKIWTDKVEVGAWSGNEDNYAADWYEKIISGEVMKAQPARGSGSSGDFDKAGFRKWSSTEGMDTSWNSNAVTDTAHFQPITNDFLTDLGQEAVSRGIQYLITGGAEQGYHADGTYSHGNGYKVDISDAGIPEGSSAWQLLQEKVNEHNGKMVHEADNNHYDIAIYPEGYTPTAYMKGNTSSLVNNLMYQQPYAGNNDMGIDSRIDALTDFSVGIAKGLLTPIRKATEPIRKATEPMLATAEPVRKAMESTFVTDENHEEKTSILPDFSSLIKKVGEALGKAQDVVSHIKVPMPDPMILRDMLTPSTAPIMDSSQPSINQYTSNIDVGGITVTGGANATAEDIGKAVGAELDRNLERRRDYLLHSRTITGSPVFV